MKCKGCGKTIASTKVYCRFCQEKFVPQSGQYGSESGYQILTNRSDRASEFWRIGAKFLRPVAYFTLLYQLMLWYFALGYATSLSGALGELLELFLSPWDAPLGFYLLWGTAMSLFTIFSKTLEDKQRLQHGIIVAFCIWWVIQDWFIISEVYTLSTSSFWF